MINLGRTLAEVYNNCPSLEYKKFLKTLFIDTAGPNFESKNYLVSENFGGSFYLVESIKDLKDIKTTKWSDEKKDYLDITETACAFDACERFNDGFVDIFLATNNAGGDCYLIPPTILHINIDKSIELTNDGNN